GHNTPVGTANSKCLTGLGEAVSAAGITETKKRHFWHENQGDPKGAKCRTITSEKRGYHCYRGILFARWPWPVHTNGPRPLSILLPPNGLSDSGPLRQRPGFLGRR